LSGISEAAALIAIFGVNAAVIVSISSGEANSRPYPDDHLVRLPG
jgi:hypothetical protein